MPNTRTLVPFLGRCPSKGCRTAARIHAELVPVVVRSRFGNYDSSAPRFPIEVRYGDGRVQQYAVDLRDLYARDLVPCCVAHRRPLRFVPVEGRRNDDVKCDARCTNARRSSCECSCGGANHGASHG